jgi:hypothetical protein
MKSLKLKNITEIMKVLKFNLFAALKRPMRGKNSQKTCTEKNSDFNLTSGR